QEEQGYRPLTHSELQLGGGLTKLGYYLGVDYGRKLSSRWVVKGSIAVEMAKSNQLEFHSYFFKPGVYYFLNRPDQRVHVSLAAGLIGMYAAFKDSKAIPSDVKTKGTNVGVFVGP